MREETTVQQIENELIQKINSGYESDTPEVEPFSAELFNLDTSVELCRTEKVYELLSEDNGNTFGVSGYSSFLNVNFSKDSSGTWVKITSGDEPLTYWLDSHFQNVLNALKNIKLNLEIWNKEDYIELKLDLGNNTKMTPVKFVREKNLTTMIIFNCFYSIDHFIELEKPFNEFCEYSKQFVSPRE